ncbi:hypothetical protein LTR64_000124 [Lithohypha guttulata]|uniref:uncharacterized protein n=1 Tax=Lithohypha guttulata TaxID=1690604 RepID=UPI002DE1C697|nr:hypothetical protein LTR51_007486 [Lithohypha guttulata]
MADIAPYHIKIPDSALNDLKARLALAKFPDELDQAGWDLGSPLGDVKRLVAYWKDKYDWRKTEAELNKYPQYTTLIQVNKFDPLNIHFVYKKSEVENAIPLLFIHGWPGTYHEGLKMFDRLIQGDGIEDPAFDVVLISLPNFGWSDGVKTRGFALEQLMLKLGYGEYVTQGGDWGFYIARSMALLFPQHVKATHLNFDFGTAPTWSQYPLLSLRHALIPYTEREKRGLERMKWFTEEGSGYRLEQGTKPQTLGYGLSDPVAMLAWIYEKLHDWTDDYPFTDDEICDWMSLYWFSTAGPAASVRIYYEATHLWTTADPSVEKVTRERVGEWIPHVKIGYSHQPAELRPVPKTWVKKLGNVVFERDSDRGGHFFAFERPDQLVTDLKDMFRKGGGAYGVVRGRKGYQERPKL